jgi:hypothetical protein
MRIIDGGGRRITAFTSTLTGGTRRQVADPGQAMSGRAA